MKRLLIVDDESTVRELLDQYFREELKVESISFAKDGFEAFVETSLHQFDLICLDQLMPHCNGDQFLTALRKKAGPNQKTTVVMISGFLETSSEVKTFENTFFLEKPVDFERLARYAKIAFGK